MRMALRGASVLLLILALPAVLLADHSWGSYHWARTSNPFNLKVGNNMSAGWQTPFGNAIADWNSPTNGRPAVLDLVHVTGTAGTNCSAVKGTVQVCDDTYGNNGWLGLATIWTSRGRDHNHIIQGTAKMNDTYFNTSTYGNANEKQHVVCQEIGHTFGLDHQDTSGADFNTCMDYFSNTGSNAGSTDSTAPNAGDYDELLCKYVSNSASDVSTYGSIYGTTLTSTTGSHTHTCTVAGHLDNTTTLAATIASSPAGKGADMDDPNEWGTLVSQSASGRSSTYELHYADGSMKVTHVFWTLEAAQGCPSCDHRYDH